jgi:hypothetical protein
MVRARETFKKSLPIAAGVAAGVLFGSLLAAGAVGNAEATAQDPAISMQIQTAINNVRMQMQNRLSMIDNRISAVERQVQDVRFTLQTAGVTRLGGSVPIGAEPVEVDTIGIEGVSPKVSTKISESEVFALRNTDGFVLAQLSTTSDGPGLVLFDTRGNITAALLSTPDGPELRMVDADGNLQTVLSGRR